MNRMMNDKDLARVVLEGFLDEIPVESLNRPGGGFRFNDSRFTIQRFNDSRFTIQRFTIQRFTIQRFTIQRFTIQRFTIQRFNDSTIRM